MKHIYSSLLILFIFLYISIAEAAPLKILFYFPGGQGTQELAQPFLDGFSEALKKASDGKLEPSVTYLSDPQQGLQYIQSQKPEAAILTLDTFLKKGGAWGVTVIAKTLQMPSSDGTNQYFLMGKSGSTLPTSGTLSVSSPQILDSSFVTDKLFPNIKSLQWQLQRSTNPIGDLRAIAQGQKEGFILLDQFEYANIARLKIAWVAQIAVIAKSEKVSSAPFVVFNGNLSPDLIPPLQNALVKMSNDPAAQETLNNLRMKGFKKASGID